MAVDLTTKKLNLAQNIITQAKALVGAYHSFKKADAFYVDGGISFAAGDFDNTTLKHVDPADMGTLITRLREFVAWYDSGTASAAGTATSDILQKVQDGV